MLRPGEIANQAVQAAVGADAALTASGGVDGQTTRGALAWGGWAAFTSSRRYHVVTGIPPVRIDAAIPATLQLGASLELHPGHDRRLGIGVSATGTPNSGAIEGPLPWAAETGSRATLFLRLEPPKPRRTL